MSTLIISSDQKIRSSITDGLSEGAKKLVEDSSPHNTKRTYARLWDIFQSWCIERNSQHLPADPKTIVEFLHDQSANENISHKSLIVYLSAIRMLHLDSGFDPSPTSATLVSKTMKSIERRYPKKPNQRDPVTLDELEVMLVYCQENLFGLRDAALLSVGFSCGFRCSEEANLKFEDFKYREDGILIYIPDSKTGDDEIALINIERINAINHLQKWLISSEITSGYVFRRIYKGGKKIGKEDEKISTKTIQQVWKKYAKLAGINLEERSISGHTARVSFVTEADKGGATNTEIKGTTRHKTDTSLNTYKRIGNLFKNHAGRKIK